MNSLLRSVWAVLIATLTMGSVNQASAQPSNERVLVVDVSKGRSSDARLVKGLSEHLERSGIVLAESTLSAQDRACESPDCIEELAKRAGAGLVITAKIQESSPGMFFITMAMFDAVRRAPLQETGLCDQCNQELLIIKLSDVADKLIRACRDARLNPVRPTQPPQVPIVPGIGSNNGGTNGGNLPKVEPGFFARLSPTRKIVAGVLGGLAVATLITSIALTATNGNDTSLACDKKPDAADDKCVLKNTPAFATGYAITGVLAVGIGFTLFWPDNSSKKTTPEVR